MEDFESGPQSMDGGLEENTEDVRALIEAMREENKTRASSYDDTVSDNLMHSLKPFAKNAVFTHYFRPSRHRPAALIQQPVSRSKTTRNQKDGVLVLTIAQV